MRKFLAVLKRQLKHHFVPGKHNAYRPKILHRSWLLFFLALSLAAEGFLVADLVARQGGENFLAAVVPGEIIALTNNERTSNAVGQLAENAQLDAAAQAKANDMALKGYFSHVGPDGKEPWDWITQSGYDYQYAGENLAVRFVDSSDVVNAWMASPTHRANIVKPQYTEIGVGVSNGIYQGQPATFVVQYFGSPEPSAAPAPQETQAAPQVASVPSVPSVEGAQTEAAAASQPSPVNSVLQQVQKQFARFAAEPRSTAQTILIIVALLLVVALAFAFFVHVEIQSSEMLAAGGVIAVIAIGLISINMQFLSSSPSSSDESASVIQAVGGGAIDIGTDGASVEQSGAFYQNDTSL